MIILGIFLIIAGVIGIIAALEMIALIVRAEHADSKKRGRK